MGIVVSEARMLCVGKRPDAAVPFAIGLWHLHGLLQEYSQDTLCLQAGWGRGVLLFSDDSSQ